MMDSMKKALAIVSVGSCILIVSAIGIFVCPVSSSFEVTRACTIVSPQTLEILGKMGFVSKFILYTTATSIIYFWTGKWRNN